MPLLTLKTNQPIFDKTTSCQRLSHLTAKLLGKPESYVMVLIEDDRSLSFGGNDQPAAMLELKSLGLPESKTSSFSAELCDAVGELTDIPANRIYIEFTSPDRHMWGWDNKTFG